MVSSADFFTKAHLEQIDAIHKSAAKSWGFSRVTLLRNAPSSAKTVLARIIACIKKIFSFLFCQKAPSKTELKFDASLSWRSLVPNCFSGLLDKKYRQENSSTLSHFYTLFGKERVQAVSNRLNLFLDHKQLYGLPLHRFDLEKLYLGLADVRMQDIQMLFEAIVKGNRQVAPYLKEDLREQLAAQWDSKTVKDLTKPEWDLLYRLAIPFATFEQASLGEKSWTVAGYFLSKTAPLRERARFNWKLHEKICQRQLSLDHWLYLTNKVLVKHGLPIGPEQGSVIPGVDGYYLAFEQVRGAGAVKIGLKGLSIGSRSTLYNLGTEISDWTTLAEDGREGIGAFSAINTAAATKKMIQKLGIDRICGFSLGGAIGQYDMTLHKELKTGFFVCSPAIDAKTAQGFSNPDTNITYVMEKDDIVTHVGAQMLGAYKPGVHVDIFYDPSGEEETIPHKIDAPVGLKNLFLSFYKAARAHANDATKFLKNSIWRPVWYCNQQSDINFILDRSLWSDPWWEKIRRKILGFFAGPELEL